MHCFFRLYSGTLGRVGRYFKSILSWGVFIGIPVKQRPTRPSVPEGFPISYLDF